MYNRHLSKLLHLILFIIFVSSLAFAQEVNDDSDENKPEPEEKVLFSPKLEWDEPEIKPTKNKKVQHVTLYGYTEEGVKVLVGKQILWVQASAKTGRKRVRKISIKKLKIKGQKYIDLKPDGSFKINLRLPLGEVQIPVGLIKGKQKARYQIALFVQEKAIELKDQPKVPNTDCRYCIWFGTGFTYLGYQQDPPQDIRDVDYGAFGFPAITFRTRIELNKNWKLRMGYFSLTGPELSSGEVTILNKSIKWQQMGLEVDYRALSSFRLFGIKLDPAILFGFQMQDLPFLAQKTATDFTIESFKFNTASLGGMFFINLHKKWFYEIFMRVQTALSSSGDVELSSGFAFDGSVGTIYRMGKNVRLGMFWSGQYHSYNYEISSEPGTYSLLSSKIDLAIGYDF